MLNTSASTQFPAFAPLQIGIGAPVSGDIAYLYDKAGTVYSPPFNVFPFQFAYPAPAFFSDFGSASASGALNGLLVALMLNTSASTQFPAFAPLQIGIGAPVSGVKVFLYESAGTVYSPPLKVFPFQFA